MASPITWRNVGTTANSSGVGALLESARRSATDGFGALQNVLDEAQQTADANREVIKGNNTADFLRQLNGYGSAEEYQAALESGELDRQLDSYGRAIDPAVVQQMFSQGSLYRDRDTSRNQYADDQALRGQRGTEDAIQADIAAGNFEGAREKLGDLQLNSGEFAQSIREAEVANTKLGWEEGRYRLAQAAGARAQQSHQVQMQEARQRQEQAQLQRDSQKFLMDGFRARQQEMDAYRQGTAQVMQDLGYKPDSFDSLSADDKARVTAEMDNRGLVAPMTDSEFLRARNEEALNNPNMTPAMFAAIATGTDQLLNSSNVVAASDQAKLEAAQASAAATQSYNEQINPFYSPKPVNEQREEVNEVVDEVFSSWNIGSIGTNRAEAREMANEWMTDGFTYGQDKQGRDLKVPLTSKAVSEIFKYTGWTDSYRVQENAEEWVQANLDTLKNAAALRTESAAQRQRTSELRNKLINKGNGTGVSDAMIDSMRFLQQ